MFHTVFPIPISQDSYPAHDSLRFGSSDDEHKPLLRINDPEPSLSTNDAITGKMRREAKRKRRVRFSETDDHPLPTVRGSLLPSKDYDVSTILYQNIISEVPQTQKNLVALLEV